MMKRIVICLIVIVMFASLLYGCSKVIEEQPMAVTSTTAETTVTSTTTFTTKKTIEATTEAEVTTTKPTATTTSTSVQKTSKSNRTTTEKVTTTQKHTTTKKETTTNGCASGNHSMGVGNIGRWFNNRNELTSHYQNVVNGWNNKLNNSEITWEEYIKKCPSGYKSWSCSSCGKWTGNFTY